MIEGLVLAVSVSLQVAAAIAALNLIRITGHRLAWALIAVAVVLMAGRRTVTLSRLILGDAEIRPDLPAELIALTISLLMLLGILAISPMFHEERRIQRALRKSSDDLRRVMTSIPDYLWSAELRNDATTTFLFFSPVVETVTGFSAEELLEDPEAFSSMVHPDDRAGWLKSLTSLSSHRQQPLIHEYRIIRRDRETRWIEDSVTARETSDGELRLDGVSTDITTRKLAEEERRNLEAQVQRTEKLKSLGVLSGGIAHDFNNILTGVLGHADLALATLSADSPARDELRSIRKAAEQAADLANELLAYSGQGQFSIVLLDLSDVVRKMSSLIAVSVSKKATLEYDLSGSLPAVEADAVQIQQVLLNLITNASEALGEEAGVITVTTGVMECNSGCLDSAVIRERLEAGRYVFLEVTDTGAGMDSGTREKMFDPFFTTKFTGRGLGLAAVLGIVSSHKGTLRVESERGSGTTIRVLFPASAESLPHAAGIPEEAEAVALSGKILLVDDEEIVRSVTSRMLSRMGFSVITAEDGLEAVRLFEEHLEEISLVLLDLTMPKMSGVEVCRKLRTIQADTPIVLSSGFTTEKLAETAAGLNVAGFLHKPFRIETLKAEIRAALEPAD